MGMRRRGSVRMRMRGKGRWIDSVTVSGGAVQSKLIGEVFAS